LSYAFPFHEVERTVRRYFPNEFTSRGQKDKRYILARLVKKLQCTRSLPAGARIFRNHHIVGLGMKAFRALCQVQNGISVDRELCFLEFLHTHVYRVCIAVNKQHADGPASVRCPSAKLRPAAILQFTCTWF
jgi:hypothetical protein